MLFVILKSSVNFSPSVPLSFIVGSPTPPVRYTHWQEMLGSGEEERPSDVGSFLYSPLGLATVAALVAVIVSAVWLVGCLTCCLWRHCQRRHTAGAVPNTDVCFLSSPTDDRTLNRATAHFSYSINSLAVEPAFHHTSLESILSADVDKMEEHHDQP